MQKKTFGKNPSGERAKRIASSPNYKDGSFQNLSKTDVMREDASYWGMLKDFFNKPKDVEPSKPVPHQQTDLKSLKADDPTIVWFGHSAYLIKYKEVKILVDPVFSGNASPVSFFAKAYEGSNTYQVEDFPEIDVLVLSHDHYDHLDYETIAKIHSKVKRFVTALGVGAHLEHWGVDPSKITELDWFESITITDSMRFTATPARHFSGRGLQRGKSLWASYVLNLYNFNIYIGGDSGYDTHFKAIGDKYGPFDIAMLECGQYGKDWPHIHMVPEETVQAAQDLKARVLMPVHWGKFTLAMHPWNESIKRVIIAAKEKNQLLLIPMIGEPVDILNPHENVAWWE